MTRRYLVWVALVLTLFSCWWVEQENQSSQTKTEDKPLIHRRVPADKVLKEMALESQAKSTPIRIQSTTNEATVNLFSAMSLPGLESAESLVIAAPVNPYTYAGRLQEDGRWMIFLTDGQQQYVLHKGDHFAEGWKVTELDQQKVVLQHAAERFEIKLENGVVF